jgi:hypothetical protein
MRAAVPSPPPSPVQKPAAAPVSETLDPEIESLRQDSRDASAYLRAAFEKNPL